MKRVFGLLCVLTLGLFLLAGCASEPEQATAQATAQTTAATQPGVKAVANVDELLAAIGPDTEILLEAGTYNLCDAADYGKTAQSPYYSWEDCYDGYQLQLHDVQNLTIRGSGKDATVLAAEPRYANVLVLQNCSDVTLADFTAGHTQEQGECSGGVLLVQGCGSIAMEGLGLYGCGVNGLRVEISTDVRITGSDLYDCSSSGLVVSDSRSVTVDGCRLYGLGTGDYGGYTVFELSQSSNLTITDCQISDCNVQYLVSAMSVKDAQLQSCQFRDNRVKSGAFSLYSSSLVLDGSTFEGNNIRNWYGGFGPEDSSLVVDGSGRELTEAELEEQYAGSAETAPRKEQTQVHVSTVDELLAAIGPDTEILLDGELYDLSTATGYGETTGEYYHWEDIFDGPGLVIYGVDNLTIRSQDGNVTGHTISATPRYANVLTFIQCSNITLSGFTAGHTKEPGSCAGGVLMFRDSDAICVDGCGLFGCGILGVQAEYCGGVQVLNCDIYECSQGGIRMSGTDNALIRDTSFRDLGGPAMMFSDGCKEITVEAVTLDGKPIDGSDYIP